MFSKTPTRGSSFSICCRSSARSQPSEASQWYVWTVIFRCIQHPPFSPFGEATHTGFSLGSPSNIQSTHLNYFIEQTGPSPQLLFTPTQPCTILYPQHLHDIQSATSNHKRPGHMSNKTESGWGIERWTVLFLFLPLTAQKATVSPGDRRL